MYMEDTPKVAKLHSSKTNEPNGVEIEFAVDPGDFARFEDEAVQVFRTFRKIKPNLITRNSALTIKNIQKYQIELKSAYVDVEPFFTDHRVYAVQGGIAYPTENMLPNRHRLLPSYSLYLEFPIGTLSFDSSREKLEDTDSNRLILEDRFAEVASFLDDRILEIVKEPLQEAYYKHRKKYFYGFSMDNALSHLLEKEGILKDEILISENAQNIRTFSSNGSLIRKGKRLKVKLPDSNPKKYTLKIYKETPREFEGNLLIIENEEDLFNLNFFNTERNY